MQKKVETSNSTASQSQTTENKQPSGGENGNELSPMILKDYEGMCNYVLKLLEQNKDLMAENIKIKLESEEMKFLQVKLEKEHEILTNERETVMKDTLQLLEYNKTLQDSRDNLEQELYEIKLKFESMMGNLRNNFDDSADLSTMNTTMNTTYDV